MNFEASGWCIHNGGVDRGKKAARLPQLPGWEGSEQDGCARIYSLTFVSAFLIQSVNNFWR